MIRAAAIIIAALAFMAWAFSSSDGMDRCQQIHSFDTCFHSLR